VRPGQVNPHMKNACVDSLANQIHQRLSSVFVQLYHENPSAGALIFVDTETSGFTRDVDIIELGAISVELTSAMAIKIDLFSELVYPRKGVYIHPGAVAIHGITEYTLRKYGKPSRETLTRFIEWVKSKSPTYLVAHNARFDEGMLYMSFLKYKINYDLPEFLCTMKMARILKKEKRLPIENAKLVTVANYFNCPQMPEHRSVADAEACAYIFARMALLYRQST